MVTLYGASGRKQQNALSPCYPDDTPAAAADLIAKPITVSN